MKDLSKSNEFIEIAENIYDEIILEKTDWKKSSDNSNFKTIRTEDLINNYYEKHSIISKIEDKIESTKNKFEMECINRLPNFDNICVLFGNYKVGTFYYAKVSGYHEFIQSCKEAISNYKEDNQKKKKRFVTVREAVYSQDYISNEWFFNNKDIPKELVFEFNYNRNLYNSSYQYLQLKKEIRESSNLSFNMLYNYSEFLRWAEKVIFYNNSDSNYIFSSKTMDTGNSRLLCIQNNDVLIALDLSTVRDSLSNQYIDEIKVNVKRTHGKQSEDHYVVIDQDCHYNDDSDLYLMNSINRMIIKAVSDSFNEIMTNIINKKFMELK